MMTVAPSRSNPKEIFGCPAGRGGMGTSPAACNRVYSESTAACASSRLSKRVKSTPKPGQEGDHKWEIAEFEVTRPAVNGAIVTVRWVARRPDDSSIWDFKDTYFLANTTHGWRILGDMVHDSP